MKWRGSDVAFSAALALGFFVAFAAALHVSAESLGPAHYGRHGTALLPDRQVTPGATRTSSAADVCSGGSTKQFRHTTAAMKAAVYRAYGTAKQPGVCCEVDHLISLELGGADDVKNLWPQPYEPRPGAHEKDALENFLHAQVCAGKIPLADAQTEIATDWYAAYQKYGLESKK